MGQLRLHFRDCGNSWTDKSQAGHSPNLDAGKTAFSTALALCPIPAFLVAFASLCFELPPICDDENAAYLADCHALTGGMDTDADDRAPTSCAAFMGLKVELDARHGLFPADRGSRCR